MNDNNCESIDDKVDDKVKESFYVQIIYLLLHKNFNNTIKISLDEIEELQDKEITIKWRKNGDDLEIVTYIENS